MSSATSKPVLGLAILALILSAAALTEAFLLTQQLNDQTKRADSLSSQLSSLVDQFNQQSSSKPETGTRTIYMVALADVGGEGYDKFYGQTIVVLKGDHVKIVLTNVDEDMDHGLAIDAYGISQTVKMGETITIEFDANMAGVFTFYCTVPCGEGHSQMTGQLIVLG